MDEKKAEEARALREAARTANRIAVSAARRLRQKHKARADARAAAGKSRFVRATGAVKALRARAVGALGGDSGDSLMEAGVHFRRTYLCRIGHLHYTRRFILCIMFLCNTSI